jgi:uncharacterized protein (UPF0332 family)
MDDDLAVAVFNNIAKLYITPEIERRRARREVGEEIVLWAAQIILNVDAPPVVRINSEIRGVFTGEQLAQGASLGVGDTPTLGELGSIKSVELEPEDANAGHFTVIIVNGRLFLQFDLRYNAKRIAESISLAREYLQTARAAMQAEHLRPAVANLFAASELVAKCLLFERTDARILKSRSHDFIRVELNRYSTFGEIDPKFVALHNQLFSLRNDARYSTRDIAVRPADVQGWLEVTDRALVEVDARRPRRGAA